MTYRRTRKRRRVDAFPEDEQSENIEPTEAGVEADTKQSEMGEHEDGNIENIPANGEEDETTQAEEEAAANESPEPVKEQEIWDGFKEENYEILEQLPLSLHRSFTLMLELDQQVHSHESILLLSLKKYIILRKALVERFEAVNGDGTNEVVERGTSARDTLFQSASENLSPASVISGEETSRQSSARPSPELHKLPGPSRQLLTLIAQSSEEIVRATNEKVNVALFAYNLVDRYIRDLDRAIKEQETSISLGLRPGTHPASIILPEVVVPTGIRPHRPPPSPLLLPTTIEEMPSPAEIEPSDTGEVTLGVVSTETPTTGQDGTPVRPRRRRVAKWSRKKKSVVKPPGDEDADMPAASSGLTLTVPPLASVALNGGDMPIDPNEPRYCYCNQVSYGEMIACDRDGCEREWASFRPSLNKMYLIVDLRLSSILAVWG
ncbi:uncharacterized protein FIBRA_08639 [Fibroporia radiculosa]|uniref:Inhibitor of growth protein N-terminal histone-binding domain-containing protein n=1 Tax=Fibroporia radiculosa TaxID=599839 RepID=J4GX66_9APHY|nr:uncharacterized protein FIBRA_08639 [Fibroporia radiculosa]CCM06380.1 predicted protein [Fibroporia radiculosa]